MTTIYNDINKNFEIPLFLSEQLKNTEIIKKFVKNKEENYLELEINHKYNDTNIKISTAMIKSKKENGGWNDFKELVRKELQRYQISKEHINLILTVITRNYKIISEIDNKSTSDINGNQKREEQEGKTEENVSLPQKLVELALDKCMLFKDEFGTPYALASIDDYIDVFPVEETIFKKYLSKIYYDANEGKIVSPESIHTAISLLEAKATFEGQTIPLHLRIAWSNNETKDSIYYDLTDLKRRCIKITKDNGWAIVDNQLDVLFRRYKHLSPQIEPIKKTLSDNRDGIDDIDDKILDKFIDLLNVKEDNNRLLLKCYIISLFIPEIAKPVLMLHGEQGSAKSTIQELIKILVDPSNIKTLTFPSDINEFVQQLSHNYIACYDNISEIKEWMSDLLCRTVTGNSFSKRQLYTNDDDFFYNFKRVVGLNGINLGATKADLLDRGLIILLERITKENRRKVEDIWKEFEEIKPRLLGYIFDILVKVLQYKSNNPHFSLPGGFNRMADWEEYAEIISRCIGESDNEFQRVYQDNIGIQIDEAIAASPLSMAVVELMKDEIDSKTGEIIRPRIEWEGTATQLSQELNNIATEILKINIDKIKSWPKSPNYLSRRLNEIKTNLREKGIEIEKGNKDKKDNRLIVIRKLSSISSNRRKQENQEEKEHKTIDNSFDNIQKKSQSKVDNLDQNQAQKQQYRQDDDTDHSKHTKDSLEEKYNKEQQEQKKWNEGFE